MFAIDKEVKFKDNRTDKTFIIRSVNDKKLIMGDYYAVMTISFEALGGIEWRGEVSKSEMEACKANQ